MKLMQSFLVLFYLLDQCWDQCQENDLGGILGAISPEMCEDGRPMDEGIYGDWRDGNDIESLNNQNIVNAIYRFLEDCEKLYGRDFSKTKEWLRTSVHADMIMQANDKAAIMYQRHHYND